MSLEQRISDPGAGVTQLGLEAVPRESYCLPAAAVHAPPFAHHARRSSLRLRQGTRATQCELNTLKFKTSYLAHYLLSLICRTHSHILYFGMSLHSFITFFLFKTMRYQGAYMKIF